MLGREIKHGAIESAKRLIRQQTNRDGYVARRKLDEIRNYSVKRKALLEMGYTEFYTNSGHFTGYKKP